MYILITDLESVLIPELWVEIGKKLNVRELLLTTRDVGDFEALMKKRIEALKSRRIKFSEIRRVVETLDPVDGASEFLERVNEVVQVVMVSDTFYEIALPVVKKLGNYLLLANNLEIEDDTIVGFRIRVGGKKHLVVEFLQKLGFRTICVGDSFNDVSMLHTCDFPILFNPPPKLREMVPDARIVRTLDELERCIKDAVAYSR